MITIPGVIEVAGAPGRNPPDVGWNELTSLNADVVIVMLECSLIEAKAQAMELWEGIDGLDVERFFAVDAAPAFTEPGPQLVDGVELLGHLLHPELMDPPGNILFVPLTAPASHSTLSDWTP